jgi:hypothetical protein
MARVAVGCFYDTLLYGALYEGMMREQRIIREEIKYYDACIQCGNEFEIVAPPRTRYDEGFCDACYKIRRHREQKDLWGDVWQFLIGATVIDFDLDDDNEKVDKLLVQTRDGLTYEVFANHDYCDTIAYLAWEEK